MSPWETRGPYVYPTYEEMVCRVRPGARLQVVDGMMFNVVDGNGPLTRICFSAERAWLNAYEGLEKGQIRRGRKRKAVA